VFIHCLRARGHTRITVAEGWGATHADWEHLIEASGYKKMTTEEQVPLVAMERRRRLRCAGRSAGQGHRPARHGEDAGAHLADAEDPGRAPGSRPLSLAAQGEGAPLRRLLDGHQGHAGVRDALRQEPLFRQKSRMHRELNPWLAAQKQGTETREAYVSALETFAERIADVLEVEAPDAVLAEGAPAMGGDGFQKLVPSEEPFAIGGVNAILVDRVGAELLGLWDRPELARELGGHRTSPLLEAAPSDSTSTSPSPRWSVTAPRCSGPRGPRISSPWPASPS